MTSIDATMFFWDEMFDGTIAMIQVAIVGRDVFGLFTVALISEEGSLKNHFLVEVVYITGPGAFDISGGDEVFGGFEYGVHIIEAIEVIFISVMIIFIEGGEYLMFSFYGLREEGGFERFIGHSSL